jgi:dTMP kinase
LKDEALQEDVMTEPRFFSFDGVDGGGKTTQIRLFSEWLREQGRETLLCRDPGSTELGERVRDLLLNSTDVPIGFRAEMLLYMAARAQLVEQVVRPALEAGKVVISDRFLLANVVYQGHAGGLEPEQLWQVGRVATGGLLPDVTFVLDIDPQRGAARRTGKPDRLEQRSVEYFERVRAGFRCEAEGQPERYAVIDADQPSERVTQQIREAAVARGLVAR